MSTTTYDLADLLSAMNITLSTLANSGIDTTARASITALQEYHLGVVNLGNLGITEKTDITTILNSTLATADVHTVIIPKGLYLISDTISVPARKTLILSGTNHSHNFAVEDYLIASGFTVLKFTKSNGIMINVGENCTVTGGCLCLRAVTYLGTTYPLVTGSKVYYMDCGTIGHNATKLLYTIVKGLITDNNTAVYMEMDTGTTGSACYVTFDLFILHMTNGYIIHGTGTGTTPWITALTINGCLNNVLRCFWFNSTYTYGGHSSIINADIQCIPISTGDSNYAEQMATPLIEINNAPGIIFNGWLWDPVGTNKQTPTILLHENAGGFIFTNPISLDATSSYVKDYSNTSAASGIINTWNPSIVPKSLINYNAELPLIDNVYNVLCGGNGKLYDTYVLASHSSVIPSFTNIKDLSYCSRKRYYSSDGILSGVAALNGGFFGNSVNGACIFTSVAAATDIEIKYVFKHRLPFSDFGIIFSDRYFPLTVRVYATVESGVAGGTSELLLKTFDFSTNTPNNAVDKVARIVYSEYAAVTTKPLLQLRIVLTGVKLINADTTSNLIIGGVWIYSNKKFANMSYIHPDKIYTSNLNVFKAVAGTLPAGALTSIFPAPVIAVDFTTMTQASDFTAIFNCYTTTMVPTYTFSTDGLTITKTAALGSSYNINLKTIALVANQTYLFLFKYKNLVGNIAAPYYVLNDGTTDYSFTIETALEVVRDFDIQKITPTYAVAIDRGTIRFSGFGSAFIGDLITLEKLAIYNITGLTNLPRFDELEENFLSIL